jgi:hypothetical protein
VSTYSGTDDFRGEIGWYRGRLEDRFLAPVKAHISGHTFLAGPEIPYDPAVGDPALEYSFELGANVKKYEFGERSTPPAPFARLGDLYASMIGELKRHPWKVLRIEIELADNTIRRGDHAALAVTFRNIGSERIFFGNPYAASGRVTNFLLECERRNVPPGDFSEADVFTIDLKQTEMLDSRREVVSSEPPLLDLPPSSEIKWSCRFRVPKCPPGAYAARLVYLSRGKREDLENQNYVDGELRTSASVLVIRK